MARKTKHADKPDQLGGELRRDAKEIATIEDRENKGQTTENKGQTTIRQKHPGRRPKAATAPAPI